MRAVKAIYFLIFALGGSVVPFISLYFQQHGLRKDQIGYIYSVRALYRMGLYSAMALHTAFASLFMGAAILLARPQRGLPALLNHLLDTCLRYSKRRLVHT